jgi:hypothetical protein
MKRRYRSHFVALTALCLFTLITPAYGSVTFSGTNGNNANDSAQVVFSLSGTTLTVTLSNTGTPGAIANPDILHAVFFGTSAISLAPVSAVATTGTVDPTNGANYNVGSGWAEDSLTTAQYGLRNVITSAGYTTLAYATAAGKNNFPGGNNGGVGANALDGTDYGILPPGSTASNANCSPDNCWLALGSVVFTLTTQAGFSLDSITSAVFQWNTALDANHSPEPGFYGALALGLTGLWVAVQRARRKKAV